MKGQQPHERLTVRKLGDGYAVESSTFYSWDEDACEVLEVADWMRSADDQRSPRVLDYAIDANDRVISVGRGWSSFARSNGAPELTAKLVVGRSLWDFVAGRSTQRLYARIFDRVRRGGEAVEILFRCDSPERARWMQLAISGMADGDVDLRSTLVREGYRVLAPILGNAPTRPGRAIPMCSFCKRCLVKSHWQAVEDALAQLDLFDAEKMPEVEHRVCRLCAGIVGDEIRGHSRVRRSLRARRAHRRAG